MTKTTIAKFEIGEIVRRRVMPPRGVVFDIDPEFSSSEEWYESIPVGVRPRKDQPFYHVLARKPRNPIYRLCLRTGPVAPRPVSLSGTRKSMTCSIERKPAGTGGALI